MNNRICLLALSAALVTACATPAPTKLAGTRGQVTVAGIEPSRVLGAIDTAKVVKHPDIKNAGDPPETLDGAPNNNAQGIAVEGVEPASVLAAIDTSKLVGPAPKAKQTASATANTSDLPPQVQKVVNGKKAYTTKDLALAQRDAVRNGGGE